VDFDGRRDEGAQGRDVLCPGRGRLEGSEESFAGREVGAVEHFGHDVGIESAQEFGDEFCVRVRELPVKNHAYHPDI
jgi:hypothetical protein